MMEGKARVSTFSHCLKLVLKLPQSYPKSLAAVRVAEGSIEEERGSSFRLRSAKGVHKCVLLFFLAAHTARAAGGESIIVTVCAKGGRIATSPLPPHPHQCR